MISTTDMLIWPYFSLLNNGSSYLFSRKKCWNFVKKGLCPQSLFDFREFRLFGFLRMNHTLRSDSSIDIGLSTRPVPHDTRCGFFYSYLSTENQNKHPRKGRPNAAFLASRRHQDLNQKAGLKSSPF